MGVCMDTNCVSGNDAVSVRYVAAEDSFRCYRCWSSDEWLSEEAYSDAKRLNVAS